MKSALLWTRMALLAFFYLVNSSMKRNVSTIAGAWDMNVACQIPPLRFTMWPLGVPASFRPYQVPPNPHSHYSWKYDPNSWDSTKLILACTIWIQTCQSLPPRNGSIFTVLCIEIFCTKSILELSIFIYEQWNLIFILVLRAYMEVLRGLILALCSGIRWPYGVLGIESRYVVGLLNARQVPYHCIISLAAPSLL